jgi:hypothetical protein
LRERAVDKNYAMVVWKTKEVWEWLSPEVEQAEV